MVRCRQIQPKVSTEKACIKKLVVQCHVQLIHFWGLFWGFFWFVFSQQLKGQYHKNLDMGLLSHIQMACVWPSWSIDIHANICAQGKKGCWVLSYRCYSSRTLVFTQLVALLTVYVNIPFKTSLLWISSQAVNTLRKDEFEHGKRLLLRLRWSSTTWGSCGLS